MSTPGNPTEKPPARKAGSVPKGLAHLGIVVGLLLTAVGVALIVFYRTQPVGNLTVCVGFGIVLAAFGSQASGQWQTWSVTGAAALAIVLFMLLQNAMPVGTLVKRGQIGGDIEKAIDLRIVDETPLYAYRDSTTKSIRFVILQKQFMSSQISIQVDPRDGEFFEMVGDGEKIVKRYSDVELIKWTYDHARQVVKDRNEIIFEVSGRLDHLPRASVSPRIRPISLISTAIAQQPAPSDPTMLVVQLSSDNQILRRNARDDLASLGVPAVKPMMVAWHKAPTNDRVKSGVVAALNSMLRQNGNQNRELAKELSSEDMKLLVAAASDEDKTVRVQAAEFLYRLKDGRVVDYSVQAVRDPKNADGVYNSIVILQPVFGTLDSTQQMKVKGDLLKAIPTHNIKTRELVQQLPVKK